MFFLLSSTVLCGKMSPNNMNKSNGNDGMTLQATNRVTQCNSTRQRHNAKGDAVAEHAVAARRAARHYTKAGESTMAQRDDRATGRGNSMVRRDGVRHDGTTLRASLWQNATGAGTTRRTTRRSKQGQTLHKSAEEEDDTTRQHVIVPSRRAVGSHVQE